MIGKVSGKVFLALIVCLHIIIETVNCGVLTERDPRAQFSGNQIDTKAKRPFCNAFTGCGRKRSNEIVAPPPPQTFDDEDTSVSELLELNSEPAIENLMRQIMSEAKMYEAIQEANREMYLQKLKHANSLRQPPSAYSMQ